MLENYKHFESVPRAADRRTHPRVEIRHFAYIELDQDSGGLMLNISEGGIAIQAPEGIAGLVSPNMRFRLPKSEKWIEAAGKLTWERTSQKAAGIQFVDLSENARLQIQTWIYSAGFRSDLPTERGRFKIVWEAEEPKPAAEDPFEVAVSSQFDSMFPSEKSLPPEKRVSADFSSSAAPRSKAAPDINQAPARRQDSVNTPLSEVAAPSIEAGTAKEVEKAPGPHQHFDPVSESANIGNLRAALRPPERSIGNPFSPEPKGGDTVTGFGYQPTPFEDPFGKEWIVVSAGVLVLLAIGGLMAIGPANVKSILLHHAFPKVGVAGPSLPPSVSEKTAEGPAAANRSSLPDSSVQEPVPVPDSQGPERAPNASTPDVNPTAVPDAAETSSAKRQGYFGPPETAQSIEAKVRQFQLEHSQTGGAGFHPVPAQPIADSGMPRQQQAVSSPRTERTLGAPARVESQPHNSSVTTSTTGDAGAQQSDGPSGVVALSSHFLSIQGADSQPNSSLQIGKLASFRQPSFPLEAARARVEGTVILRVLVDKVGIVESVQIVSGPPLLVPAAIDAVREWRYGPTILDGRAVGSLEEVTVTFRLGNTASVPR
jgi:TonB family protein